MMTSNRPYLIRAFYDWITDNQLTATVLINTKLPGVEVPKKHIIEGKIILNISPQAVHNLHVSNQLIEFDASFSGKSSPVYAPIQAVLAIYARENGQGMVFTEIEEKKETPPPHSSSGGKPKLTIVK